MADVQIYKDGFFDNLIDDFHTLIADDTSEELLEYGESWYDRLMSQINSKHGNNWTRVVWFSKYRLRTHYFESKFYFDNTEHLPKDSDIPIVSRAYLFGNEYFKNVEAFFSDSLIEQFDMTSLDLEELGPMKSIRLDLQYIKSHLLHNFDEEYEHVTAIYNPSDNGLLMAKLSDAYDRIVVVKNFSDIKKILDSDIKFY